MKKALTTRPILIVMLMVFVLVLSACGAKKEAEGTQTQAGPAAPAETSKDTAAESLQNKIANEGSKNPVVTIEMDSGKTIKVELYPKVAPNTVNNFISLVKKGFYDGTIFHRVIPGFMIQGGDPEGTGAGGPGYNIKGEFTQNNFQNDLKHTRGVISMARTQMPDTAGSQFFIMAADYPSLDGLYASFGKVTEGMEVVDEIVNQPRDANDAPNTKQVMKKVTVDTFGVDYKEPETLK
ncbi:peptidylprolyl isomerase [Paenibacillus zeisoli]|uniref:Peptidyl-prolyl cis-trans isomerase n=1 Tax=Paenibacillus zeisoli TaxID=2496267 RepID=A0A433X9D2_9BACL|nr:peptidylprolyl isomerase [Paenibacillus zeisoli]RUT30578.1 peptidylprolyl isomerase [Paenibacillus zeisoli]